MPGDARRSSDPEDDEKSEDTDDEEEEADAEAGGWGAALPDAGPALVGFGLAAAAVAGFENGLVLLACSLAVGSGPAWW